MAEPVLETHRFCVYARHLDRHRSRVLEETSFEAAAVAYVEDFFEVEADSAEVRVIVCNLEDGREHCFTIDLESGEAEPC
ncbi:MAG: DUF5961 family protein [Phenylobacterium sp.]|uniref:DUF5961 family protein n=1 Tax=Phenylobacterium sp. TaxID=1871053 RepID=UPI00391ABB2A